MFTVFNSESLWIGTDLKRFNEIRIFWIDRIKYKYKVKRPAGRMDRQRNAQGTRGKCWKSSGAGQSSMK